LRIIGDGPFRNQIEAFSRQWGLLETVIFQGIVPQPANYFKSEVEQILQQVVDTGLSVPRPATKTQGNGFTQRSLGH
jgi:hypothetical protein